MPSTKPIQIGTSKRLEELYTSKKAGLPVKPAKKNAREDSIGQFNEKSLNYSTDVLGVTAKKYK